jgi:hypothetical protein
LELRRQYEAAEPLDPMEDNGDDLGEVEVEETEVKPKKKAKAVAKKPKATKTVKPAARMRVVWQVLSDAFKVVATYDYNQKEAAEAKAAELTAKGRGTHFVQRAKEAMAEDAPGLGASIPRTLPKPAKVARSAEEVPEDVEDDLEEEDEEPDDDYEDDSDEE